MTPGAKTIDSSSNLRKTLQKERPKSYRVLFRFLSSCYSSRDNGRFSWEETVILQNLTFDDLWWPEYWPERKKNDRNDFERSRWELSIAFFRVFLALLVFELVGGHFDPPPPPGRRWLRGPPGRGLSKNVWKKSHVADQIQSLHFGQILNVWILKIRKRLAGKMPSISHGVRILWYDSTWPGYDQQVHRSTNSNIIGWMYFWTRKFHAG